MPLAARSVLALSVLGLMLSACGRSPPPTSPAGGGEQQRAPAARSGGSEEKLLNVYNWSDYVDPTVLEEFTRETGIKVNYDVFDSNEVLETKLLTGNSGYDVVVPSAAYLQRLIGAGAFQKLDKSRLPNLGNLDPALTEQVARYDPGNAYGVTYQWGTSGIGYNAARIRERMADAPVDSLAMLFDPKIISRFRDCGVTMLDAPSEVVGTVLIHLGRDANSESAEDLAAAEKVLMSIRPYIRYINSSKYIEDLANGEICLALGWSGDVLQARDRAREAGKTFEIGYRIPREGALIFFDTLAIPRDAPHPGNAHLFIDYLLRPDVAAKNSSFVNFGNSNAASWPLIAEPVRTDPGVFPSEQVRAKLVPDLSESARFSRQLTRSWQRFKTGR